MNAEIEAIRARQEERHRDAQAARDGTERVMTPGALNKDILVADVDFLLDKIDRACRWIPVTERLPREWKEGKTISDTLVCLDSDMDKFFGFYSIISGWHDYLGGHPQNVTHWLELPLTEADQTWRGLT